MTVRRKVLITGVNGQVGALLSRHAVQGAEVLACDRSRLDLQSESSIRETIRAFAPDLILNAAAYTAVDQAESDIAVATAVNTDAVRIMAEEAKTSKAKLIHFSTDYVFDGEGNRPYHPASPKNPKSVYGKTKSQGEEAIINILDPSSYLVLRTAWVYAPAGKNFVSTMLRLMQSHPQLRVISDQIGTPTSAQNLALATWSAVNNEVHGVHHYTDAGVASWYDFACVIGQQALRANILKATPNITPIFSVEYPQAASRPIFGVLDKSSFWSALNLKPEHWSDALQRTWFNEAA